MTVAMPRQLEVIFARLVRMRIEFERLFPTAATPEGRVEVTCILSFFVCLLGSFDGPHFPLAINLSVALLGLICCRSKNDLMYVAYVFFWALTAITDIIFVCTKPSGFGVLMVCLNLLPKLAGATCRCESR